MKEDQDQGQVHFPALSTIPYDTCSLSCPKQLAIPREQLFGQQGQEPCEARINASHTEEERMHKLLPVKWTSSKIRLMRKMMGEDQMSLTKQGSTQASRRQAHDESSHECSSNGNNSPAGGTIRVCSNCSTTTTPLWRSGPQGPKSLCNACGIRQMKARRAMRAAADSASALAGGGGLAPASAPKKAAKERSEVDRTVPFKKRFKIGATPSSAGPKKLRFDDVRIALSKKLALNQAFPQEEKEAAILLMALSYGLIHG